MEHHGMHSAIDSLPLNPLPRWCGSISLQVRVSCFCGACHWCDTCESPHGFFIDHMSLFGAWSIWWFGWFGWLDDPEEHGNFAARPTFRIISEDINEQRMNSTTSCFTCHDIHHSSLHHCTELKNHTVVAIVHRADGEVQHVAPPVESLESDLNLMWVRINVRERQAAKARLVFPCFFSFSCSGLQW